MSDIGISLALPTYNEAENLEDVVSESVAALERLGMSWEILVIDNASTDETAIIAEDLATEDRRIRVIRHEENRLYAGSCASALRSAGGRVVAIMDSDGQATANDLPLFLERLEQGANLVFGWRRERHDPWARMAMSWMFNLMGRRYLGYPFHDLNCGYRVFDRRSAEVVEIRERMNLVNPELYVRAVRAGLTIDEVPIEHRERRAGETSHNFARSLKLLRDVNAYFRRLRRELIKT